MFSIIELSNEFKTIWVILSVVVKKKKKTSYKSKYEEIGSWL